MSSEGTLSQPKQTQTREWNGNSEISISEQLHRTNICTDVQFLCYAVAIVWASEFCVFQRKQTQTARA